MRQADRIRELAARGMTQKLLGLMLSVSERTVDQKVPSAPVVYMSGDSAYEWVSQGVSNSVIVAKPFVVARASPPSRSC